MATDDETTGTPPGEPTVKELLADKQKLGDVIDATTRAELERWFGLPSFTEVEEGAKEPVFGSDAEMAAVAEQRQKALAAIDPALVELMYAKAARHGGMIVESKLDIELRIDPDVAYFDQSMLDRQASIAEPREYDLPLEMKDDLRECTPQALLRDLHRSETEFEKQFEINDPLGDLKIDVVEAVDTAMKTSWKLPPFAEPALNEARAMFVELKRLRRLAVADIPMPTRTVQE